MDITGKMDKFNKLREQLTEEQENIIKNFEKYWLEKDTISMAINVYNFKKSLSKSNWGNDKFYDFMTTGWKYVKEHFMRLCYVGEFCQLIKTKNITVPLNYAQIDPLVNCIPREKVIEKEERTNQMLELWKKIVTEENIDDLTRDVVIYHLVDRKKNSGEYHQYKTYKKHGKRKRNDEGE